MQKWVNELPKKCNIVQNVYKPHDDILVISKKYYCPLCDKVYSCDEHGRVIEAQKFYKRKIVTNEEINKVYSNKVLLSMKRIKKLRWILLFPIIGGIICMFLIFNGELRKKTKSKDGIKLLLSSMLVSIGVALIIKLFCSMFDYIELINNYKIIFMLIPFLLSFNLPILWYIPTSIFGGLTLLCIIVQFVLLIGKNYIEFSKEKITVFFNKKVYKFS